jgi:1-aminocyclopropane-1-carboxylate deaminase
MSFYSTESSILQTITSEQLNQLNVRLMIKRDDLIDEEVSGNKWRKLKFNIEHAQFFQKEGILTFGGAYSNHLIATAAASALVGLKSIGIVRGEELTASSNHNLKRCEELGMQLIFIPRSDYDLRNEKEIIETWKAHYPNYYLVPEGGANFNGMVGCQEIWKELPQTIQHVFVAQGTTTTSCGILLGMPENCLLHVVPVLKGFDVLSTMKQQLFTFLLDHEAVEELLQKVVVHDAHHFGGYGKKTSELESFISKCKEEFDLPLDFVYTGKAFSALVDWLENRGDCMGEEVLFLHTGGLTNG